MNKLVISVVIPTFNSEKYMQEAIESVINQSYTTLQILILDDGSTDNSLLIARSFTDVRIEIYESKQNHGQSYQLNKGILKSKGDYISIMHSDDVMNNDKLEQQLFFLNNNPLIGICGCNVQLIGKKNDVWIYPEKNQDCKDLLLSSVPFAHPSILFKKSILNCSDFIYDQQMVPVEDYDLWVRIADKINFGNVQKVLLQYRIHPNQIGNIEKRNEIQLLDTVKKKIVTHLLNIDEKNSQLCFMSLYYSDELNTAEVINGLSLLWKSNNKGRLFSSKVLKGKLKHILYKTLSNKSLRNQIIFIIKIFNLFGTTFLRTIIRIIFTTKKST